MRAPYDITIRQVDNGGFSVNVGCKTLVYTTLGEMANDLCLYFNSPDETIKRLSAAHGWAIETGALIGGGAVPPPFRGRLAPRATPAPGGSVPPGKRIGVDFRPLTPNITSDYGREQSESSGYTGQTVPERR